MSYDYLVCVDAAHLPSSEQLLEQLNRRSVAIAAKRTPTFSKAESGFLPMTMHGVPTGVELLVTQITEDRRAAFPDLFADMPECDIEIMIVCHDSTEIAVGRIFADVLTDLSGGSFCDPQTGEERRGTVGPE